MKNDIYKGRAGVALFFHFYGKKFTHAPSLKLARGLVVRSIRESLKEETDLSLYAGIPGILWAGKIILGDELRKHLPVKFQQALLLKMAESLRYSGFHELAHGASGWYIFSESVAASGWFRDVVQEYLKKTKNFEKNGWWTASGEIGFGMAHGICAPLLIRKSLSDVRKLKAFLKPLLNRPLPPLYPKSLEEMPVQSAWCYGDAGAGFAFTKLALETGDASLAKTGKAIFRRGIYPGPDYRKLDNPFICHGYAGQALMALRFWKLTREAVDKKAVDFWKQKLSELAPADLAEAKSAGLHDGLAGLGLVTMALIDEKPGSWDRLLMLS